MKLNDKYTVTSDKYQWILTETYEGKSKDGDAKAQTRQTYHGTLEQVLNVILDRESKGCETIECLKQTIVDTQSTLALMVKDIQRGAI